MYDTNIKFYNKLHNEKYENKYISFIYILYCKYICFFNEGSKLYII